MEIGTFDGGRARHMIETAMINHSIDKIRYFGFDLFESLNDDDLINEFSKKPPTIDQVKCSLKTTGAKIELFQGYSRNTLPIFYERMKGGQPLDLIFIDGGHSKETIQSDWNYARKLMGINTVVLFDDYYNNDEEEVKKFMQPRDQFKKSWGILKIHMAQVKIKDDALGN